MSPSCLNDRQLLISLKTLFMEYLSSDERQDVHLAGVGVFHRRDNEAGSTQCDLALGPAVHRQRQLPFPHVEHPRELHALRAAHAARLTCREIDTMLCK